MKRYEEAQKLRMDGKTPSEIAEIMDVKESTIVYYLYSVNPSDRSPYPPLPRKRQREGYYDQMRRSVHDELRKYELPAEWEEDIFKSVLVYRATGGKDGGRRKTPSLPDIQSIIVLFCRRYRIPTPRALTVITHQGRGSKRLASGYMDALAALDGVEHSKPIEYISYFVGEQSLPSTVLTRAEFLMNSIPMVVAQSRNPRVLAAVVLYEMLKAHGHKHGVIYTQRYISNRLQITEASLRTNWAELFRGKEKP